MSATADIVERWREVTAGLDPETAAAHLWKDGPVGHFLHAFRPDGARLPELFAEMACSYELAFWVLSPLADETRDDPFAPAAALWEAGVRLSFEGEGAAMRAVASRRSVPAAL